ncbi:MFS transporter [Actinokineospora sp. NBRC 105648]|uniref:MFS transporter n=1 Tax=Actinokineospora sp. NBRC 105648 TaxID=3032206 RepID=UPI0024A425E2|nr:MFS transporter [Actinokineospora sp. NBRC 105648]GLZ39350.1 hypothetical protein Acsp05_29740 [Actinokineospora sp. NBRC 105648]
MGQRPGAFPTAAAFVLFVALGAANATLGVAMISLRERHHLDLTDGASMVTAFYLGSLAAIVGCGLAERVLAPRPAMTGMIGAFAVGVAGIALAPAWALVLVAAVVAGLGFGGLALHLNTSFAHGFGRYRVLMVNLLNAAFGVGAVAGPLLVGLGVDVRGVLVGVGVVSVLCVAAARCPVPRGDTAEVSAPAFPVVLLTLPFALVGFLYGVLETSAGTWEATYLIWTGTPAVDAARMTALFWLGLTAGRVVISVALFWAPPAMIICCGFGVAAVGLGLATGPDLAVLGFAVAGFGIGPVIPTLFAWLAQATTRGRLANSVLMTCSSVANAVAPVLIGFTADQEYPAGIPLTLAVFAVLGVLAALWTAYARGKKETNAPASTVAAAAR